MKYLFCCGLFTLLALFTSFALMNSEGNDFETRIIASGLSDPWSVVVGQDNQLWVNESKGYRVLKIDPDNGVKKIVLDLNAERQFPSFEEQKKAQQPVPQGGLMGLALHPQFLRGKPFVYLSYVYRHLQGNQFLLKLARYRFNASKQQLEAPVIICDTIPASNDHNGGRLIIAPVNGKHYLFYAVGDQGSGQFSNGGRPNKAQQKNSYEGKILRFNLEPEGATEWIPADNPALPEQSAIWTVGHRNPQGLAFAMINKKERLYASEHGPYSDDEINLIEKGGNYGHPLVIGYNDGNYDHLAASVSDEAKRPGKWHTTYPLIISEKSNAELIGKAYKDPKISFYPTSNEKLTSLFEKVKAGTKAEWEAYAPSGIAIYQSDAIPGWSPSLLVTTLKTGKLLRLKINNDGSINPRVHEYFSSRVRYRDVAVANGGTKIYLATDSSAVTSGPSAENPKAISQRGCILELKYFKK